MNIQLIFMTNFDPENHDRQSIRMKGYDYSKAGNYFVTICTQNKLSLFGEILKNEMNLNASGEMVKKWWLELALKFKSTKLHEYIVMPNHFHGIIEILKNNSDTNPSENEIHRPIVSAPLPEMVQWFKTMSTNEYIHGVKQSGWKPFEGKVWQRNYYEHIIRDRQDYLNAADYIRENPIKWKDDEYNQS